LIRRLVLASSNPGDLVADPFAGSGTTAVVAEAQGRRWVAYEADPTFVALAAARIQDRDAHAGEQTVQSEAQLAARRGKLRGRRKD
jgi:DNA modification methylase